MIDRLLPFVVALIAVALFFGYTNPTYTGSAVSLRGEIESYDNALAAADDFEKKEAALIAERNSIAEADLERLKAFLPDGVDNVQLILDLDSLANRSGVRLSDFEIEVSASRENSSDTLPLEGEGPVDSLTLGISAAGTYSALRTFLAGVEQGLRPLDLVAFTVSDSETGVYTYNMVFAMYWLR